MFIFGRYVKATRCQSRMSSPVGSGAQDARRPWQGAVSLDESAPRCRSLLPGRSHGDGWGRLAFGRRAEYGVGDAVGELAEDRGGRGDGEHGHPALHLVEETRGGLLVGRPVDEPEEHEGKVNEV